MPFIFTSKISLFLVMPFVRTRNVELNINIKMKIKVSDVLKFNTDSLKYDLL